MVDSNADGFDDLTGARVTPSVPAAPSAGAAREAVTRATATAPRPCELQAFKAKTLDAETDTVREVAGGATLHVVAEAEGNHTFTIPFHAGEDEPESASASREAARRSQGLTITYNSGGTREVTLKVESRDGSTGGSKRAALVASSTAPGDGEFRACTAGERTVECEPPADTRLWPYPGNPRVYYAYGKGCETSGTPPRIQISSYPSQQYEVALDLGAVSRIMDRTKRQFEALCRRRLRAGPVRCEPEFSTPRGSLACTWGWKEQSDWKAGYEVAVRAGLEPLCGMSLEFQVSLLRTALAALFTSWGIPPNISDEIAGEVQEHAIDIYVFFEIGIEVALTATGTVIMLAGGGTRGRLRGGLDVEATVGVGLGARAGSEEGFHVVVRGSVSTGLNASGGIEVRSEGVFLDASLTYPGATAQITFQFNYGDHSIYEGEPVSAEILGPSPIWQAERCIFDPAAPRGG